MIAVPVWSNGQFLVILISFAALILLIALALLGLFPRFRRWLRRHNAAKVTVFVSAPILSIASVVALVILFSVWRGFRMAAAPESARHVTLAHDKKVDEFDLPAGTRIDLYDAYTIDRYNIKKAAFPHAVEIHNILSTTLSSDVYGFEVTPVHDEVVDGWVCQAGQSIHFRVIDENNKPISPYLTKCSLAKGNKAGELAIPAGSSLQEALGELDHAHAVDIGISGEITFGELHASLTHVCLRVAGPAHDPILMDEAILARPLRAGTATLPAGTTVTWSPEDKDAPQRWSDDKKTMYLGSWTFMLSHFSGIEASAPCIV